MLTICCRLLSKVERLDVWIKDSYSASLDPYITLELKRNYQFELTIALIHRTHGTGMDIICFHDLDSSEVRSNCHLEAWRAGKLQVYKANI
jgi:hypothetical protein